MDDFWMALFFIRNELTALYTFTQHLMMYTCIYSAVTPCYCSMLGVFSKVVSFEACCQLVLLSVQITRHYPTVLKCTVQKYIYPSVSKVLLGLFVFP